MSKVMKASGRVRTTVDFPLNLRTQMQSALSRGAAKSQNALIIEAVERYLDDLQRTWIDEQFAALGEDESYQTLQLAMVEEWASIDKESWALSEVSY